MSKNYLAAVMYPLLLCLVACNQQSNAGRETPLQLDTLIVNGLVYDGSDMGEAPGAGTYLDTKPAIGLDARRQGRLKRQRNEAIGQCPAQQDLPVLARDLELDLALEL